MQTQAEHSTATNHSHPGFGIANACNALSALWSKASDQLTDDELKWFAGLNSVVEQQTMDLAGALESLYCHTVDNDTNDMRDLLLSLSHHANSVAGIACIGASATNRLIHSECYANKAETTAANKQGASAPKSAGMDWKEVKYWADNHLVAVGDRYRLIDNASKAVLTEFDAISVSDAEQKVSFFLRKAANVKKGGAA